MAAGFIVLLLMPWQAVPGSASEPQASPAWFDRNTPLIEQLTKSQDSSGYYWDETAKQFVIRVSSSHQTRTAQALKAAKMSAPVRLEHAAASQEAVDGTLALIESRRWLPTGRKFDLAFYYDAVKDVTVVQTNAPASATEALKRAAQTPLEVQHTKLEQQSRSADPSPHFGGAKITNLFTSDSCTSGFAVVDGLGHRYMITAGHCGEHSDPFSSSQYDFGWITNKAPYPTFDLAALTCTCGGYVAQVYITDTSSATVHGATAATVGATGFYTSGQTTKTQGGRRIISTNATFCREGGCTHQMMASSAGRSI